MKILTHLIYIIIIIIIKFKDKNPEPWDKIVIFGSTGNTS